MHELVEGIECVKVITDDSLVVGVRDSHQEAVKDHDKKQLKFVTRCEERGIVLNIAKLQLRQREVPFIGHITSDKRLQAEPAKVRAIIEMPALTVQAGVQWLLGIVQYLSKFLPHLSDMITPL